MIDGTLPGYWDQKAISFTAANGTQAKILFDVAPAQVVAAISGEGALPGEGQVRQRVLQGGQRVIDGLIASTDSAAKSLLLYLGEQLSLYANMGTVTTTATTNATVTRMTGSFITDGWGVGDTAMAFGCVSSANNGTVCQITGVTATTLTLYGVGGISVAETQGAGFRLVRIARLKQIGVPANAGNADATQPVSLLAGNQTDTTGIQLGATGMLICAMFAAVSALPARVDVSANRGLY